MEPHKDIKLKKFIIPVQNTCFATLPNTILHKPRPAPSSKAMHLSNLMYINLQFKNLFLIVCIKLLWPNCFKFTSNKSAMNFLTGSPFFIVHQEITQQQCPSPDLVVNKNFHKIFKVVASLTSKQTTRQKKVTKKRNKKDKERKEENKREKQTMTHM